MRNSGAESLGMSMYTSDLASYPGHLTPAFVACRTSVGKGLVELIARNDVHVPGYCLDTWRSGIFSEQSQVSKCTTDRKRGP